MNDPELEKGSIPAHSYKADYYETACEGYKEFSSSRGRDIPMRLKIPLNLANIKPGMQIVDIGCGRGEIVYHTVQSGALAWGLDYSKAAVEIASMAIKENISADMVQRYAIQQSDATQLPFENDVIDRVFMLDVVEHLTPQELKNSLQEVHRILKPEGLLIIHTMPSVWYYRYGYPIYRFMENLRQHKLPANPRDRCDYSHFHVNEQSLFSLRRTLKENKFTSRVWLQTTQDYVYEKNPIVRWVMKFLVSVYPFRWIFCDDIFAIGMKNN